jgi:hypothetical protein
MAAPSTAANSPGVFLIKRAIELDTNKRYEEALVCYKEGIELLLDESKGVQDVKVKLAFREKISSYIERAEKVKKIVDEIKECNCSFYF